MVRKHIMSEKNRKQVITLAVKFDKVRNGHCRRVKRNDQIHREKNHAREVYSLGSVTSATVTNRPPHLNGFVTLFLVHVKPKEYIPRYKVAFHMVFRCLDSFHLVALPAPKCWCILWSPLHLAGRQGKREHGEAF